MWFGSLGSRERAHPFPSKLSFVVQTRNARGPSGVNMPREKFRGILPWHHKNEGKKKKKPFNHWKLRQWRKESMAHYPSSQPLLWAPTYQLTTHNSELAGWGSTYPAGIFLISKFLLTPHWCALKEFLRAWKHINKIVFIFHCPSWSHAFYMKLITADQ